MQAHSNGTPSAFGGVVAWQVSRESGTGRLGGLDLDESAVGADDSLGDIEPQAEAARRAAV